MPEAKVNPYYVNQDLRIPEGDLKDIKCTIGRAYHFDMIHGKIYAPVGESDYEDITLDEYIKREGDSPF